MSNKFLYLFVGLVIVGAVAVSSAHATTGGPTYVYGVRTAQKTLQPGQKVIYVESDHGGKGCPPVINSLNFPTGSKEVLLSCDEGIEDPKAYQTAFDKILAQYPVALNRINLRFKNITAKISVVREIKADEAREIYYGQTDFSTDIFQNDKKLTTITYSGCSPYQAHILEGYSLPGSDTIVLSVSTIGDCFEGGYTRERLFMVPNLTIYPGSDDSYNILPLRKEDTPALADASGESGNIVVFASVRTQEESPTPLAKTSSPLIYQVVVGILGLIVLLLIVRKRKLPVS